MLTETQVSQIQDSINYQIVSVIKIQSVGSQDDVMKAIINLRNLISLLEPKA